MGFMRICNQLCKARRQWENQEWQDMRAGNLEDSRIGQVLYVTLNNLDFIPLLMVGCRWRWEYGGVISVF